MGVSTSSTRVASNTNNRSGDYASNKGALLSPSSRTMVAAGVVAITACREHQAIHTTSISTSSVASSSSISSDITMTDCGVCGGNASWVGSPRVSPQFEAAWWSRLRHNGRQCGMDTVVCDACYRDIYVRIPMSSKPTTIKCH
jgi:hypothetical protein